MSRNFVAIRVCPAHSHLKSYRSPERRFKDAGKQQHRSFPFDMAIVLHRVYNGRVQPQWHSNGILSGYRSKEYSGTGYNEMVLDDATGQNRARLFSSTGNSLLHLGYHYDLFSNDDLHTKKGKYASGETVSISGESSLKLVTWIAGDSARKSA
jgi:uncharacterized protein involved in type VI secretion and phage assembly